MTPEDRAQVYVAGVWGILIDHVTKAMRVAKGTKGRRYVVGTKGRAIPILCGDIVPWDTEDGPSDGRCGQPVHGDFGQCDYHAAARIEWASLTERERAGIERIEDEQAAMGRF